MRYDLKTLIHVVCTGSILGAAGSASAAFVGDSKASLDTRNFYMNRDFRQDGATQSKAEEWAQGLTLRLESGFTEGPIGLGIDVSGLLGIKLDSSPDRVGTGLLKTNSEAPKRAKDEYRSTILVIRTNTPGRCVMTTTLQRWVCPD